jgi:hypothetical protein
MFAVHNTDWYPMTAEATNNSEALVVSAHDHCPDPAGLRTRFG